MVDRAGLGRASPADAERGDRSCPPCFSSAHPFRARSRRRSSAAAAVGRQVGRLYAANTAGAVAGVILGGLVLIPAWGVHADARRPPSSRRFSWPPRSWPRPADGCPAVSLPAAACARSGGRGRARARVGFARHVERPRRLRQELSSGPGSGRRLSEHRGGRNRPLLSGRPERYASPSRVSGPQTLLRINGKIDAGTLSGYADPAHGRAPAAPRCTPRPATVFILGLGSGITAAAAARHPVERVDVLEIEPAVVEASRFFAGEHDGRARRPPRPRPDRRRAELPPSRAGPRYDVIISEPSNPWIQGMAGLFSVEFFALARERLRPGGVMLQWLQTYNLAPDDLRMVVATVRGRLPGRERLGADAGRLPPARDGSSLRRSILTASARDGRPCRAFAPISRALPIRSWAGMLGFFALREDDAARLARGRRDSIPTIACRSSSARRARSTSTRRRRTWPSSAAFRARVAARPDARRARGSSSARSAQYWIGDRLPPARRLGRRSRPVRAGAGPRARRMRPSALGASTAALQLGRHADALALARRALAREPARADGALPRRRLVVVARAVETTPSAIFERAVALEPQNVEFRGALARLRRGTLSG